MLKPLYHRLLSERWLITEAGAVEFATRFVYEAPASLHARLKAQADSGDVEDLFGAKLLSSQMWGNVGVLSINGALIAGGGILENLAGGISHGQFENALAALADRNPAAIVLSWNSPGGSVSSTPETAGMVADISSRMPVYSYCGSSLCASAAYWIGSSASAGFYASPSALVGSIGCIMQTVSIARLLENAGVDVHTFSSAPLKSSGNTLTKMSGDQSNYLQSLTDEIGEEFKSAVRKNRPSVKDAAFTGQLFSAKQAGAMGLTDGTFSNLAAMVGHVQEGYGNPYNPNNTGGLPRDNNAKPRSSADRYEQAGARAMARGQAFIAERKPTQAFTMADFKKSKH